MQIAPPASLDVTPAGLAFSATGDAAVTFGVQNADNPAISNAFAVARSPRGRRSAPREVPGAQEILDLAYDGASVLLLAGASPAGDPCCSSVQVVRWNGARSFGRSEGLLGGLAGATAGRLVTLPGAILAAIATERGVWVSQAAPGGRFGRAFRLTPSSAQLGALDAMSMPDGESFVAWTAGPNQLSAAGPRTIMIATGSSLQPPGHAHAAITVPTGHRIDELGLAPGPFFPTVAWIESWFDSRGLYHSQAAAADLTRVERARRLSPAGELASGLAFAADDRGDQVVSWKACESAGDCTLRAALRAARGHFSFQRLPAIDASQTPSVAVSPTGEALLGWVSQGHVLAAEARPGASRLGPARIVSPTGFAANLSLSFGPARQALAVWAQGTLAQSVIGAVYSAP